MQVKIATKSIMRKFHRVSLYIVQTFSLRQMSCCIYKRAESRVYFYTAHEDIRFVVDRLDQHLAVCFSEVSGKIFVPKHTNKAEYQ